MANEKLSTEQLEQVRDDLLRQYWLPTQWKAGFLAGAAIAFLAAVGLLGYATSAAAVTNKLKEHKVQEMLEEFGRNAARAEAIANHGFPIGSILGWHRNILREPDNEKHNNHEFSLELGDAWLPCDGRTVTRKEYPELFSLLPSDVNEFRLPKLNSANGYAGGRFLRGGNTSGTRQGGTLHWNTDEPGQPTKHGDTVYMLDRDGNGEKRRYDIKQRMAEIDNKEVPEATFSYSRPVNMSVVWIIRVK